MKYNYLREAFMQRDNKREMFVYETNDIKKEARHRYRIAFIKRDEAQNQCANLDMPWTEDDAKYLKQCEIYVEQCYEELVWISKSS